MASPTTRLFVALWPDDAVRAQLAQWRDGWTWPRAATPVKKGRRHVTLHFLGDVAAERIPAVAAALDAPFTPFELRMNHASLWPHGIAVLEPETVPQELVQLHALLADALRGEGCAVDARPYRPHVTLARRANGATLSGAAPCVRWTVASYALMASTLGKEGGYTTLRRYPG
jgi:2'-5' RNA ligase